MPRYRFDFYHAKHDRLATHEIDYADDEAAIAGGHLINGSPTIGCCFEMWRDGQLIHRHHNAPHDDGADEATASRSIEHLDV
jgi:hypothetical protein